MKQLEKAFEELNISANKETILKFEKYMNLVLAWNKKVNLTAITDKDDFIKKHFIDSVLCAGFDEITNAKSLIDIGTGAGFPGVPLALIFPCKQFLLVDSLGKRIKILNEILTELEITNALAIHARAEELAHKKEYREKFDVCVSRAVATLATLAEYCLPFVSVGGTFVSYKGPDAAKELKQAEKAIKLLGGTLNDDAKNIRKISVQDFELDHNIIIVNKMQKTPSRYPRKAGTPSKEPI